MLVTDGVLVFGLLRAAKIFAERSLDTINWPNLPERISGGTVKVHRISFITPAVNGLWEQVPLYPDANSTTACGALFRHQDDFRDATDAIMKMERAEGFVICNDPTPVLSQGIRFIGRYDWHYSVGSDGYDDDKNTYKGEYCLVGSRDSVRESANRHEAQRKGAMLAEFDEQEYMFGRQWFTEDGKLRALLVYTYNMPDFFADCRLGTQLLAPPLDFTQPNDRGVDGDNDDVEFRNAVMARHPNAIMVPALKAGAFSRVLALFANRSMPVDFFMEGLWATNPLDYQHGTLRYDSQMWDLIDHRNESVLNALRAAVVKTGWLTGRRVEDSPVLTAAFEQAGIAIPTEQQIYDR